MTGNAWLGIGLGAVLGLAYDVASVLNAQLAARYRGLGFLYVVIGGMMARMAFGLTLVGVVLHLTPALPPAFVAALMAFFLIGLVVEIALLHRQNGIGPI